MSRPTLLVLLLAAAPLAPLAADDHAAAPAPARSPGAAPGRAAIPAPPPVPRSGAVPGGPRAVGEPLHRALPAPPRHGPWRGPLPSVYPYAFPPYYGGPLWYGLGPAWGWGWSYGWSPGWPYDPLAPYEPLEVPPPVYAVPLAPPYALPPPPGTVQQAPAITTRFDMLGGANLHGGGMAGLALEIAGKRLGFHAGLDGLYPRSGPGAGAFASAITYTFATAHLTVALLSTERARLRVELGGSVLSWPSRGPDAGLTTGGPDFGVAGQARLVGPLGAEGHFRWTPTPVPILDARAALALRFGPVAVTAGWRELSVRKSDENAARFAFGGPQLGVGLRL